MRISDWSSDVCSSDLRIWVDSPDADPATELREALRELGCAGKRLGVEYDAYGLPAANGKRLAAALQGFCSLDHASGLVSRLRAVKSAAENVYRSEERRVGNECVTPCKFTVSPSNLTKTYTHHNST